VLENGVVVVLELKGKAVPSQADIDQVFAYARDLMAYHRDCADRPVHAGSLDKLAISCSGSTKHPGGIVMTRPTVVVFCAEVDRNSIDWSSGSRGSACVDE
jgi:hypothetical protein